MNSVVMIKQQIQNFGRKVDIGVCLTGFKYSEPTQRLLNNGSSV
jgi:hypothetical protein